MTTPKFLLLGLIKGSETALGLPNHVLDYETYQNLRRTYTLDYALFEAYERLKLKRGEHDPADRWAVTWIMCELKLLTRLTQGRMPYSMI